VIGGVSSTIPVDIHVRGCPPTPTALLSALLALLEAQDA
jgi:NADH:ubiquinone oxidoreductase subunit B-like Fe-S oxidoreductase